MTKKNTPIYAITFTDIYKYQLMHRENILTLQHKKFWQLALKEVQLNLRKMQTFFRMFAQLRGWV